MSDLVTIKKLLKRVGTVFFNDWKICEDYLPAVRVMSVGCPDGKGSYAQLLFDDKERLLEFRVFDLSGKECRCACCAPMSKPECCCEHSPCKHDAAKPFPKKRKHRQIKLEVKK